MADEGAWAGHLRALKEAGTDQARFKSAHSALAADKSVGNEHLARIVRSYDPGGIAMGRNREAHMNQIHQAFTRQARFENKIK